MMIALTELAAKPSEFLRTTGIKYTTFTIILSKLEAYVTQLKTRKPLTKRGRKSAYALSTVLLLTLIYLRHYCTFLRLGQQFGISESYAQKRYSYMPNLLTQVLDMPDTAQLTTEHLAQLAVDVSQQPIERPISKQVEYYSGKKKTYHKGFTHCLFTYRLNYWCIL